VPLTVNEASPPRSSGARLSGGGHGLLREDAALSVSDGSTVTGMSEWALRLVERAGTDGSVTFDSVPHPSYTKWTGAHLTPCSPMSPPSWTQVDSVFERSKAKIWSLLGVIPSTHDDRFGFLARLGDRRYISVTSLRQLAARMPGVNPARIDAELDLDPSDPHVVTWRDRLYYPCAVLGTARLRAVAHAAPSAASLSRDNPQVDPRTQCDSS
jgi:hypothetical protein